MEVAMTCPSLGVRARLAALLLVLALPSVLSAQQVLRPIASIDGRALFTAYCVQCHGTDAKGNGPRAASLKHQPPALTQIAKRNGGTFNREAVAEYIMGTREGGRSMIDRSTGKVVFMTPEGPAEMPAWGNLFRKFWPDEPKRLRFDNLAKYLEKLQEK